MVAGACIACEHWQGPFAWHLYAEGCGRTGSPGTFTAERRFNADPRRLVWRMSAPVSCPAPVASYPSSGEPGTNHEEAVVRAN